MEKYPILILAEEEDMIISENGGLNLSVELSMSVKGDYQDGGIFFLQTPGQFTVKSGGQIEFSLKGFAATDDDTNEAKGEVSMQIYQGESLGDALSMHTIAIELDGTAAPIHVDNFIKHVDAGNYDGTIFHRIIDNFMIQGGDFRTVMVQADMLTSGTDTVMAKQLAIQKTVIQPIILCQMKQTAD